MFLGALMLAKPDLPIDSITLTDGLTLQVWDRLEACRSDWLTLETDAIAPVFQSFAWQRAWFNALGREEKASPFIVILYQDQRPVMGLPFACRIKKGVRRLVWSGGKHSNFNFGLVARALAAQMADDAFRDKVTQAVLDLFKRSGVDLVQLRANPQNWLGHIHPLTDLGNGAEMTPAFGLELQQDFAALFEAAGRKRMRKKYRWQRRFLDSEKLSWRLLHTDDPKEFGPFLQAFYAQKQARFKALGIEDIFSQGPVQDFINRMGGCDAADSGMSKAPCLHFYGLEVDGRLIATYAGASHDGCFSAYFNSFDEDYLPRLSAGEMLLGEMIQHRTEAGDRFLDLGMGDERYKHLWCDVRMDYFTCSIPLTLKGQIAASGETLVADLKRTIRSNETLWAGYKKLRKAKMLVA